MRLADFDYELPEKLIAQTPARRRDQSRLLVFDRASRQIRHARFRDLPDFLAPDDLLVLNDSAVIPARVFARIPRGASLELLLLEEKAPGLWEALAKPGKRARVGQRLRFADDRLRGEVVAAPAERPRLIRLESRAPLLDILGRIGEPPLPPYIQRSEHPDAADRERYQTVYAGTPGSVAAPTAGLHFTPEMLAKLKTCRITLHVGYGTFQPIRCPDVREHRMHGERFEVSQDAVRQLRSQRDSGQRLVCVGTTTTRVIEHLAASGGIAAGPGKTDLFIYPGYRFAAVGALLTNFHLPRSTLLLLVSAFAGTENVRRCYLEAIRRRYRFYSYGDAMLIL